MTGVQTCALPICFEIVIRDNLAAFTDEKTDLKKTIAELQTHSQLAASKQATMMADCQYKQQTIERVDAVCAAQKKEIAALREENVMMKHALRSMKEQTQALLEGHLATCRSQYVSKLESQDLKLAKAVTMLATVMRGHGVRQQVRSDNRHLRDKLQALESEMKTHLELKAT